MDWDYYRRKAMECLTVAKGTREPARRSELLSIAQSFMLLAQRAVARPDHRSSSTQADDGTESPDRAA
jgi:hypothetical protein